jgi:hypothetical protein
MRLAWKKCKTFLHVKRNTDMAEMVGLHEALSSIPITIPKIIIILIDT